MSAHRAGSWNLRKTRDPQVIRRRVDEVEALLDGEGLDWLAVQEAAAYTAALRRRLRGDYRVVTGRGSRSRRDSALIVRRRLPLRWKRVHVLGGIEWERAARNRRHGLHPSRHMVSARIGGRRGYRVGSPHLPPTPWARRLPLRARSHAADVLAVLRIVRRWTRRGVPWVLAGDWNVRPSDRLAGPLLEVGTARGRGIDWTLGDGVQVTGLRRVEYGTSDHLPVVFTVRRPS